MRTRRTAVRLAETVEDEREKARRDSFTGIAHRQLTVRVDAFEPHLHFPSARRELDRIREQVPDDLLEPVVIAGDLSGFRVEHSLDANLLRIRGRSNDIDGGFDDVRELDRLDVDAQLPGIDAREVEDVLDEPALCTRVAVDRLQPFGE